ncbi:MAG TPA: hypothetical protein VK914_06500 [bacterium]|nr:hypothetical protein [bacterium]
MKPLEEPPERPPLPVARETWSFRRLIPSLGFVALVSIHEVLGCVAAILWYHDRSFVPMQVAWYCAWEFAVLAYFFANHLRIRGSLSRARLAAFWALQAAWFALGLWCYAAVFAAQAFAVEGVGGWLALAYLWAALAEDLGRPRPGRKNDDSYFSEIFKNPMTRE